MKKINGEYTFSEAVAKAMEFDELQKDYEELKEQLCKTYERLAGRTKKCFELLEENEVLARQMKVLINKNKELEAGEWNMPNWQLAEEKAKNANLTKENEKLTKQITEEKAKNKKLAKVDKKYNKLSKENEKLNKQIAEEKAKNDDLTNEVELLKQKDAMRENQIESLNKYIKLLESGSNNQEDDDTKLYPEYHTHDTFKVHNKLAEVVSVLVDEDDVVHGYEIKFEDSDDIFFMYPEEIED